MEKKSLVIALPSLLPNGMNIIGEILAKWLPVIDNGKTIYTVRDIQPCNCGCGEMTLSLEEGVVGEWPNGREIMMPVQDFKEVQPNMDVNELIKEMENV